MKLNVFSILIMLLSVMTMPVSSQQEQQEAESANGSMDLANLRGSQGHPLQVVGGDSLMGADDTMVTVETAMKAEKKVLNRWKKGADYPAGIMCALLYLEVKVDTESTSGRDSTDEEEMQKESVPIGASVSVIRDLMEARLSSLKKERSWNENQFMTALENQTANGRLIRESNGNYKLSREVIYMVANSKGKKGSGPKLGRQGKEPKKSAKKTSSTEGQPQSGDDTRHVF